MMRQLVVNNVLHRPIRTIVSVIAVGVEVALVILIVGLTSGQVIARNFCHGFAPSMSAASYNSGDTPCNAARYRIML